MMLRARPNVAGPKTGEMLSWKMMSLGNLVIGSGNGIGFTIGGGMIIDMGIDREGTMMGIEEGGME